MTEMTSADVDLHSVSHRGALASHEKTEQMDTLVNTISSVSADGNTANDKIQQKLAVVTESDKTYADDYTQIAEILFTTICVVRTARAIQMCTAFVNNVQYISASNDDVCCEAQDFAQRFSILVLDEGRNFYMNIQWYAAFNCSVAASERTCA